MALQGLQNYTFPLTLLGETTVNGNLNVKDIYVNGTITGTGSSSDILGTDNIWTGTNDFQQVAFYTGVLSPTNPTDMLTKEDIDDAVTAYDPLSDDNVWTVAPVFSNANPPVLPVAGVNAPDNILLGYADMQTVAASVFTDVTKNAINRFTGINTFTNTIADGITTPFATLPQHAATKEYIDQKMSVSGNTVAYVVSTLGQLSFTDITGRSQESAQTMDYWLFSGSCGGASGSMVSGTIGNGLGQRGSLLFKIGNVANPATVYTTQLSTTLLPSSTAIIISPNIFVANAAGACNLNGTIVPGIVGNTTYTTTYNSTSSGQLGANNIFAYNNIFGTTTSIGGAILVVHYI